MKKFLPKFLKRNFSLISYKSFSIYKHIYIYIDICWNVYSRMYIKAIRFLYQMWEKCRANQHIDWQTFECLWWQVSVSISCNSSYWKKSFTYNLHLQSVNLFHSLSLTSLLYRPNVGHFSLKGLLAQFTIHLKIYIIF